MVAIATLPCPTLYECSFEKSNSVPYARGVSTIPDQMLFSVLVLPGQKEEREGKGRQGKARRGVSGPARYKRQKDTIPFYCYTTYTETKGP